MGFNNPDMPWSELERRLSWGKAVPGPSHPESRHRQPYEPPAPASLTRGRSAVPYAELAERLKMSENAVKVSVHRLRQRYRELLREEVAHTVAGGNEVEEELQCLFRALSS